MLCSDIDSTETSPFLISLRQAKCLKKNLHEAWNQIPARRLSSQSDALRPFLAFERARPHDFELLTHS